MLGDNIKELRKQKGYSQETLAEQLNVVRQTVSKWEKGYSVPDAEMLEKIAILYEVPVSDLLDSHIPEKENSSVSNEIANQLAILNEHLAKQATTRKRTRRIILACLLAIPMFILIVYIALIAMYSIHRVEKSPNAVTTIEMKCTLDGEEYHYGVSFDDQYRIISAGGDAWIANHVQTEQYGDANVLMAQIEDYFTVRGGTFEVIGNEISDVE